MTPSDITLSFTMPLPLQAHAAAQMLCQHYTDPQVAKRAYLNTLATYAVHAYLKYFGINTKFDDQIALNPVTQLLTDTGALRIGEIGQIECRPVLPGEPQCDVPPEVQSNRIGYIPVQLNETLEEATLLGFTTSIQADRLDLQSLKPIEDLLDYLEPLPLAEPASLIRLSNWLHDKLEVGWQSLDELSRLITQIQPALNFRGRSPLATVAQTELSESEGVQRGQLLNLVLPDITTQVALLVRVSSESEYSVRIRVMLSACGDMAQLPTGLEMMILDDQGVAVMQAQARETDAIELRFGCDVGDHFEVKIAFRDTTFVRTFVA